MSTYTTTIQPWLSERYKKHAFSIHFIALVRKTLSSIQRTCILYFIFCEAMDSIQYSILLENILNKSNCVNTATTTFLSSLQKKRLCYVFFFFLDVWLRLWLLASVQCSLIQLTVYLYLYNTVNVKSDPKCVNNKMGKCKLFFYKFVNEVLVNLNSGVCKIPRSKIWNPKTEPKYVEWLQMFGCRL